MTIPSFTRSRLCVGLAVTAAATGGLLTSAARPAEAASGLSCHAQSGTVWPKCTAEVVAVDKDSYLVFHNHPNYSGGAETHSVHMHDGQPLVLRQCTKSDVGDADGHGDHYWFVAYIPGHPDDQGKIGWVNDWYVSSGSHADWKDKIPGCP